MCWVCGGRSWGWSQLVPARVSDLQMDTHRETDMHVHLRCRRTQTHTDATRYKGICKCIYKCILQGHGHGERAAGLQMQMHSLLCTHILITVSPLDLAVWPGHDGDCSCRVIQSTSLPQPSGSPVWLLPTEQVFDDIWPHPTDAHERLTELTGFHTIRGWTVNRQSSEVDVIYHISSQLSD